MNGTHFSDGPNPPVLVKNYRRRQDRPPLRLSRYRLAFVTVIAFAICIAVAFAFGLWTAPYGWVHCVPAGCG